MPRRLRFQYLSASELNVCFEKWPIRILYCTWNRCQLIFCPFSCLQFQPAPFKKPGPDSAEYILLFLPSILLVTDIVNSLIDTDSLMKSQLIFLFQQIL